MEYCSVAWHDNLTQAQKNAIERLQVEALKIILGSDCPRKEDGHVDYIKALSICNLKSLFSRREKKTLDFGIKCIKHPTLEQLFPTNTAVSEDPQHVSRVKCHVSRLACHVLNVTKKYMDKKIPHTRDTESLDRCG